MVILLVDAIPGEVPSSQEFEIATSADLPLTDDAFRRMAMIYNVTELCTAVKPWAMEMLFDRGAGVVTYLDPDIEVFGSLDGLAKLSLSHSIVLTPHTIDPIPRDGLQPTEADIMHAGAYNLGYITVSAAGRPMLDWWKARLERDSVVAPEKALFVDQRWIDLVPGYFDHCIVRDPEFNVAYWNLHERELTESPDGQVLVDGRPLSFFHYSGYSPDQPWILNKYYSTKPRVRFSSEPVAYKLCCRYAQRVTQAEQDFVDYVKPYGFDHLADGTEIVGSVRNSYRNALKEAEELGLPLPPVPFRDDDSDLIEWLRSPARPGSVIGHFLIGLWQSRVDLQAAFPDPFGASERAFWGWTQSIDTRIEPEVARCKHLWMVPTPPVPGPLSDEAGVNVSGYLRAELGIGEAGRLVLGAVEAAGLPASALVERQTLSRQQAVFSAPGASIRYPVTVAVVNADLFPLWAHTTGVDLVESSYVIGMWAWELEQFPDYPAALELVDEIWAYSEFVRRAISATTDKPVHVMPLPVLEPTQPPPLDREQLGLSDRPYLLFVFDYLSVLARKNPLGLIDAFSRAFAPGEGPQLVIKSINGDKRVSEHERVLLAAGQRSDIHVIDGYLPKDQVQALMADCLGYVSLHRSEGLGLTMAEAMAYGKPVIATAYSGNLDFMSPDTALLVPYRLAQVGPGALPYAAEAIWAEPDLDVAADHMRWVFEHRDEAGDLGLKARRSILQERSVERAAEFVQGRVASALDRNGRTSAEVSVSCGEAEEPAEVTPAYPEPDGGQQPSRETLRRALDLVHTPPNVVSPSRVPQVTKRTRQAVYRVLAHHDERANEQLTALVRAVDEVDSDAARSIRDLDGSLRSEIGRQVGDISRRLDLVVEQVDAAAERQRLVEDRVRNLDLFRAAQGRKVDQLDARLVTAERRQQQAECDLAAAKESRDADGQRIEHLLRQAADASEHLERVDGFRSLAGAKLDELGSELNRALRRIEQDLGPRLDRVETEMVARPYTSEPGAGTFVTEAGGVVMGYQSTAGSAGGYASFEDTYRGSEDFIASLLADYVPLLLGHDPVVDIGCGRGELLGLLRANGVQAIGVDTDKSMLARCADKGLDVEQADGIEYLSSRTARSVGAVTSIQVVEHMAPAEVAELISAAFEVLKPGGVLVAETVNPHSPAALKAFWLDLTHVRPLYPESLLALAREAGFESAHIHFPGGTGDLDEDLRRSGSYALIAYKAAASPSGE